MCVIFKCIINYLVGTILIFFKKGTTFSILAFLHANFIYKLNKYYGDILH